jgi:hypothetical protein
MCARQFDPSAGMLAGIAATVGRCPFLSPVPAVSCPGSLVFPPVGPGSFLRGSPASPPARPSFVPLSETVIKKVLNRALSVLPTTVESSGFGGRVSRLLERGPRLWASSLNIIYRPARPTCSSKSRSRCANRTCPASRRSGRLPARLLESMLESYILHPGTDGDAIAKDCTTQYGFI